MDTQLIYMFKIDHKEIFLIVEKLHMIEVRLCGESHLIKHQMLDLLYYGGDVDEKDCNKDHVY